MSAEILDPETKVRPLSKKEAENLRPRLHLSPEKMARVKKMMKEAYLEWDSGTSILHNLLQQFNDRMEGVKAPKNFPWPGASNLAIPLTEIHVAVLHSVIASTMLDNDPVYSCRDLLPGSDPLDPMIERFLQNVCKEKIKLDVSAARCIWNALKDPLSVSVLDWIVEYGKRHDMKSFKAVEDFQKEFPTPEDAGLSEEAYSKAIEQIVSEGEYAAKIDEKVIKYEGPDLREVEMKDLVWAPVTSPSLDYCVFVGDKFHQRDNYFRVRAKLDWFDKAEVNALLVTAPVKTSLDAVSQQQDRIDGISRVGASSAKEYLGVRGNLRIDLNDDGEEEMYAVVYCPDADKLVRIEEYPYWHNRLNYIPWRIRPRSNRLAGRCITHMLFDINEEVDTQHNQRIDSRTITTVPIFKKTAGADYDPSRKDQRVYPGMTVTVKRMDDFTILETKQTDMGQSLQEEQTLFQVAEWLSGASPSLRSGTPEAKDPRAPAKKAIVAIGQSNIRIDDYIRELKPSLDEIGVQILDLYYQFSPQEVIGFADMDSQTGQLVAQEIERTSLRNRNMSIQVSRTSIMDNPEQISQRALIRYQIWSKEPLIGSVLPSRHELVKRTMVDTREKNIQGLLPDLPTQMNRTADQNALNDPMMPESVRQMQAGLQGLSGAPQGTAAGTRQGGPNTASSNYEGATP